MSDESHAFVESPLQFLSALEAHEPGEQLIIHARKKATGMASFLKQLPRELIPHGVAVLTSKPHPEALIGATGRILIGDPFSGKFQRPLLMATGRIRASFVLLDDGYATVRAARLLSDSKRQSLVRAKAPAATSRRLMGAAAAFVLRTAMRRGRLSWHTALPVDDRLAAAFATAGGRLERHAFERLRSAECSDPELVQTAQAHSFILGTALAADGLIDAEAYVDWVRTQADHGPAVYFAHRRQSKKLLKRLGAVEGLTVLPAGLPVELRMARAPRGARVASLPSTALTTLPLIMAPPDLQVTPIPAEWWTGTGTDALRRELNELALAAATRARQQREAQPRADGAVPTARSEASAGAAADPSAGSGGGPTSAAGADPVPVPGTPPGTLAPRRPVRIVAVSDSESYLKWAAHTLDGLEGFDARPWLIDTPIRPTAEQVGNALAGTTWEDLRIPLIDRSQLARELSVVAPDVVLAASTGPVVQQVFASAAGLEHRPGLVSGLPGVGLPARRKGMEYRRLGDLFIAHSEHERLAYEAVARKCDVPVEVVVARLPMLASPLPPCAAAPDARIDTVVFAPQAKVPADPVQREEILLALASFARNNPGAQAIVKVRSRPGEQETHREQFTYAALLERLVSTGRIGPDEVTVGIGPMSRFLQPGSALVTVSSTAALESIDRGLPTLIVSDFGVSDELLNAVFEGSGILGSLADVAAGRFGFPTRAWLEANYFQPADHRLHDALGLLATRAREHQLGDLRRAARVQDLRRLRAEIRTLTPDPVVRAYRRVRYRPVRRA